MEHTIILASNSPRRRELLAQIGLTFTVAPADVDERLLPGEEPKVYAERLAREKARAAAEQAGTGIVIAADTIVVVGGAVLGKPSDAADARRMLRELSVFFKEIVVVKTGDQEDVAYFEAHQPLEGHDATFLYILNVQTIDVTHARTRKFSSSTGRKEKAYPLVTLGAQSSP